MGYLYALVKVTAIALATMTTWAVGLAMLVFGSRKRTIVVGGLLTLPLTLLLMGCWLLILR